MCTRMVPGDAAEITVISPSSAPLEYKHFQHGVCVFCCTLIMYLNTDVIQNYFSGASPPLFTQLSPTLQIYPWHSTSPPHTHPPTLPLRVLKHQLLLSFPISTSAPPALLPKAPSCFPFSQSSLMYHCLHMLCMGSFTWLEERKGEQSARLN